MPLKHAKTRENLERGKPDISAISLTENVASQLAALMRTNINVQELTVAALMKGRR